MPATKLINAAAVKSWTNFKIFETLTDQSAHVRPMFRPRMALNQPARAMMHVFYSIQFQPQHMRPGGSAGPHGKGLFMTFDRERYRGHLAPLKLSQDQEDDLLDDLWSISETLVDQSLCSPTYPLHLAIADSAFRALDEAIAVHSQSEAEDEEAL